jgi:hypothetical protein
MLIAPWIDLDGISGFQLIMPLTKPLAEKAHRIDAKVFPARLINFDPTLIWSAFISFFHLR